MAEADEEGQITRAYGFNPHTQQARTNEEDEDAEEGSLWSTDSIWQADLAAGQSLKEASYHYLVTDHLGVPVLALNKAGEATWKARYEAFGKARIDHASTAQINLRLPGQYFDAETGLHQNWNRDYAPGIGRYVQADPIGLAGGLNVYQYAYGNPGAYIDPNGEFALVGAVVGGALNFGWQLWQNGGRLECINIGDVVNWAAIGSGFGGIVRSGINLGFRAEMGKWGAKGSWTNARYKVPHFHIDGGPGLVKHHLPFQAVPWIKNFISLYKRKALGDNVYYFYDMAIGASSIISGAVAYKLKPNNACAC